MELKHYLALEWSSFIKTKNELDQALEHEEELDTELKLPESYGFS